MAGGMGGMAPMHGAQGAQQGKEKRRDPLTAPDEDLYIEDRPWTEAVIGNRRRRDVHDGKRRRAGRPVTDEMHPEVAAVLQQAQRLQSLMDEQLYKMNHQTFIATDDAETVEVTMNGHHHLTGTFIADGLLRLGAPTVEQRLNEALQKATDAATESIELDRDRIDAAVADITADLRGDEP